MESPDPSWLPEAPDLPWPPRWAPVSSAPPWWAPVSSAPPWWAPVSSAPPWWAPVSSAPHGPGPPFPSQVPPPLHRPPGLFYVWSVRKSLFGGGALSRIRVMILHPLTIRGHSLTTFSCTTLQLHITHGLHFPSTIALITQLSPITHYTTALRQTRFISFGLHLSHCEVLFSPVWHFRAFTLSVFSLFITRTVYTTLTVCCLPFDPACLLISSLSATCPDLCPCLCICLAYVTPVTELCLSDLLLFVNKAALGSQRPWPLSLHMLSCGSTDNRSHLRVSRQWVECCSLREWHQDETTVFTGKAVCSRLVRHYRSSERTEVWKPSTRGKTRLPFCYWSPRISVILCHSFIPKKTYLCFFNITTWNLFHTLWGKPVQLCLRDR